MIRTSPSSKAPARTASRQASSVSKQRAGPRNWRRARPAIFTMAPSGARLPLRPTTPPCSTAIGHRPHHVLILGEDNVGMVFGERVSGHGESIAMEESTVEKRPDQHRNTADSIEILGHVTATRLEIAMYGVRRKTSQTSSRVKSMPASWAMAGRCSPALVEPPVAATTTAAFSSALRVTMSRGLMVIGNETHDRLTGSFGEHVAAVERRRCHS